MTQQEKLALQRWEEFHKGFARKIDADTTLTTHQIERQRAALEADPVAWMRYFFPTYASYEFAPFHLRAIKRLTSSDEWYEVLSWSRELAKSTIVMMVVSYLVLTGRKKFVVLASATEKAAVRLLTPYRISFESNARLRQFYGELPAIGAYAAEDFSLRNGTRFVALGAGSAPRGIRNEEVRPDVILADDYDEDEACRNPETLNKRWEWFNEALYPTRSISTSLLVIWCGNIIAKDCCITRAGALADNWDVINIRDKHGKSTWPAKNTEAFIDRTLKPLPKSSQQKEYFNNPVSEGKVFKNMPLGKMPPLSKFKFLIGYGDPAYSDRKTKAGSFKALVLVGKYKTTYYILKAWVARETNAGFIGWYFSAKEYVGGKVPVYWYMENNKLQDPFFDQVFRPLLRSEVARRGQELHIIGDTRAKTDKATRIEASLEPIDREGGWVFNVEEADNPHMQELIEQGKLFEMHLPYPADGMDALEGAISMIQLKTMEHEPPATISYAEINETNRYRL